MKLYKYVGRSSGHAEKIALKNAAYMSNIKEMRGVNHVGDFIYPHGDENSVLYSYGFGDIVNSVNSSTEKDVFVLCMSKSKNEHCWDTFCQRDGVIYEFDFDPYEESGITRGPVKYTGDKIKDPISYLTSKIEDEHIKSLLKKEVVDSVEMRLIVRILRCKKTIDIINDYFCFYAPFAKPSTFSREDEYRFVHTKQGMGADITKICDIVHLGDDNMMPLPDLRLKLVRIETSYPEELKGICPQKSDIIFPVTF